jgi:hypothetical protein
MIGAGYQRESRTAFERLRLLRGCRLSRGERWVSLNLYLSGNPVATMLAMTGRAIWNVVGLVWVEAV